jgi:diaminopimelate epimerase
MKLAKWQGLGNDYLIVEQSALPGKLTIPAIGLLCDRHLGVGSDGILLNAPLTGSVPGAVARMRVLNPDGSEPEMCGNGIRMFARYLARTGSVDAEEFAIETLAGPIRPRLLADGAVRVDMGRAVLRSDSLEVAGARYDYTFVDVGNPHCVIVVDDPATFDVTGIGPLIERHAAFPHRANVEFIKLESDGSVRMRVWERGVGETQACGTGATAVGAACVCMGLARSPVLVHLEGGDLTIEVDPGQDYRVFMTGPAEEVFVCELSAELVRRLGWPAPPTV